MKKALKFIGVLVIIGLAYVVYKMSTFSLLGDVDSIVLEEINMPEGYSLKIYFSPSNATIQDAIVVMKVMNGKEELVDKFDRYDYLESYRFIRNDSLELVIRDTSLNKGGEYRALIALPK
jgi:hypothetical protein